MNVDSNVTSLSTKETSNVIVIIFLENIQALIILIHSHCSMLNITLKRVIKKESEFNAFEH